MNIYIKHKPYFDNKITVTNRKCIWCKHKFYKRKYQPDNNLCQSCQHWADLAMNKDNQEVVRYKGQHYIVGEQEADYKGMGGQKFIIKFDDGRTIETDNLWHQGNIPESWLEILSNNATIILKEQ